ncbi:prephenate dehydrogenase [Aliarcobacter cryaerophilus]|uniref:prephenate dehydrogenase n=4 Tax=Arcobacteraceae TaxID=2808963 RepID=A0AA96DVS6_9BACT|nr:prephenate dehydrogenase [Aliarcobacter cryaerophilus]WNL34120.1 prephenate dehydrogenase [Arcobacter sp. AZ-2023]WPD12117.1 prephenate dehydrogenase [Arcobacter sp. DSM 115960]AYJ78296.1 chorismate mutase / prephenate dehydrogenase [Aliarcobacter cryaerophilus D2610]MCT7433389.1 prephenate dehydrogenase [Aliarcobacter cryaerophilus]MCT7443799.1 prephenate dehydrogenase [Aliarcobacter cryaerophilus]
MNIGIIGLGLMGGSLAKAVKRYGISKKVYGFTNSEKNAKEIEELGLVDELVDLETLKKVSDVIILSIPVDAIISMFPNFLDINEKTTIIDMGSTKEYIVKNIPPKIRKNFIAAHPMTGTEKNGPKAAIDNLYEGKTVVLCDLEDNANMHVNKAFKIFQEIGMRIVVMNSHEHDVNACYISHLPHLISFSLANTVMSHQNPKEIIALAAGGFKDMSRIAKSSPRMWGDIFKQNRENMLESIKSFEDQMNEAKKMIEEERYEDLENWMKKANSLHEIL